MKLGVVDCVYGLCSDWSTAQDPLMETKEERKNRLDDEKNRKDAAFRAATQGFFRGSAYGLSLGLGASLLAQRYSTSYRALRLPIKAVFVSMALFGAGSFAAEHAIYRLNRPIAPPPTSISQERKTLQILADHRLGIVSSAVGMAVLGTGYRILQNRNTTGAQKFMNIRLYGQMAGLGAIILLMGITAAKTTVPDDMRKDK